MTDQPRLRVNILGPVECWDGAARIRLGGLVHERVLVSLLLEAGQVLPVTRLVEAVWDADPPATATHQVRKAVARLRQVLPDGAALIRTDGPGYRAVLGTVELDLALFTGHLRAARQATAEGRAEDAAHELAAALVLWRGPVLSGTGGAVIEAASTALEERRLTAVEQLVEHRLDNGYPSELVGDLRRVVDAHPLRERLRALLMRALFRSGRQAEALEEYETVRRLLADELGIDPGDDLSRLHAGILRNDPALAAPVRPTAPPVAVAAVVEEAPTTAGSATLPYDVRDFTGRRRELSSLLDYAEEPGVQGPRIVAIDGLGGSGKTSLAVHAAHQLAGRYPGAQLYLDLHGFTPGEDPLSVGSVAEALLRMLGVAAERIPEKAEARIALWRAMAAQQSLLLLLDNARATGQVQPLLPATSSSLVLITSRARLIDLDGAHWISLGMMTPDDSVALVAETLGKERVAAEPEATAALTELCGHLPLALRIAAARLRNRPRWTISYLVDRLGNETRRLDELRSGERSVRVTLTLSYEGLDATHRAALRLLARHPGYAVDVHSAAALLGVNTASAEEVLENLLDTHLMQQNRIGYYTFHDLVRSFALDVAEHLGDDNTAALRRLLDFYLTATDEACDLLFPGRVQAPGELPSSPAELPDLADADAARKWLDDEQSGLRGAIVLAHSLGLYRHAADLARNVVFQLDSHGQFEQFREVATIAVAASRALDDQARLRLSLSNLAVADWRLGRLEEAITSATDGLAIAVQLGDRRGEAKDTGLLGLLLSTLGRFDEALTRLSWSIELKRQIGAVRAEAESLTNLSSLYEQWGHYDKAADAARRAVELNRKLGARENEVVALADLTVALLGLHRLDEAAGLLASARGLVDDNSSPGDLALVYALSATVCHRRGERDEAAGFAERALEFGRSCPTPLRQVEVENIVGRLCRAVGKPAVAVELHRSAHSLAAGIGYRVEEARALRGLADAHRALGDAAAGQEFALRAEALFDELGVPAPARDRD